jgi:acyl-CoA synthetase (AMP-forming)/AMP-acid ligase II
VFKDAPRTLADIYAQARTLGSRSMVVEGDLVLSYSEIFARAACLSTILQERFGVVPGTKVALAMGNRAEWIIALIAVTAAGGIAALINSRGTAEEMSHAISSVGCSVAILDRERAELMAAANCHASWTKLEIEDLDLTGPAPTGRAKRLHPVPRATEDGAVILYTSGTTGRPKGALLSHGALAHAASLSKVMGALQDLLYERESGRKVEPEHSSMAGPAMVLTPMFHLTGVLPVVRGMSLGATIHIMGKWNVDTAFDMIETSGLSRIALVPTMLWDMIHSPRATPENLAAIRHLAYGGGPLNMELVSEIRRRMPNSLITNTYGQTENTGWACSLSGKAYLASPQSCGWACPTVGVCVRRENGSDAAIGEPGELWVRSAAVMSGYVGDAEATEATLDADGWCATGDIGMVDERGLFTILDRKKNMVISGGENIYCAEVERVLFDHAAVREAIAFGLPDPRLGERLAITVVVEPEAGIGKDEILAYCRERLAIYKVPRVVELTSDPLPKTATGKIDRPAFLAARQALTGWHHHVTAKQAHNRHRRRDGDRTGDHPGVRARRGRRRVDVHRRARSAPRDGTGRADRRLRQWPPSPHPGGYQRQVGSG